MHTPDWNKSLIEFNKEGELYKMGDWIRLKEANEQKESEINLAREEERQLAQVKVLSEYTITREITREATVEEMKKYWYHAGKWHNAECLFLQQDEGVCNCKNIKPLSALSDMTKHE